MEKKQRSLSKLALVVSLSIGAGAYSSTAAADICTDSVDSNGKKHLSCTSTIYYYNPGDHAGMQLSEYDSVTVVTTTGASTSPLQGWAVYGNSSTYNFKELNLETVGSKSDGIVTKNGASNITIDKLKIRTTGSSADGINVGKESNGTIVTVGDNADIDTKGMGVRANSSANGAGENLIVIGKSAFITSRENGSNTEFGSYEFGTGYAVYAGNTNSAATGEARVVLGDNSTITSLGNNAHAVYANKGGVIELGSTTITATGTGSHGIYAEAGSKKVAGVTATVGSKVYLAGDTAITIDRNGTKFAIYAKGVDSLVSSSDRLSGSDTSGIFTIDGNLKADNKGTVDLRMTDGSSFTGMATSNQYDSSGVANTTTDGIINLSISGANSVWNMTENSVVSDLTLTGATLKYVEPADLTDPTAFVPKNLIVAGNYASNNGVLVLNTVLEDDTSATDKLIVKGDTSGHTDVKIVNIGGNGALTTQGIEIVQVEGNSVGTFGNSQRIVAGAFDYFVRSGSTITGADANNWYLISDYSPTDPGPDPDPDPDPDPEPGPDPDPDPGPDPDPDPEIVKPVNPVYRPEAGSYLANLAASNTMFITRLHDRLGETQYTDALTGEKRVTSMWMRHVGGQNRFSDGSRQLRTTSNRYVMQLGGDLAQWSTDGLDRWHVGLMAGYANNHNHTKSKVTGYTSKGSVDGYSVGLYGTWYANREDKTGTYIDTWLMYSWFDNEVKGQQLANESYKSRGATASIEGGYSFKLGASERATYWIQPKAQVIWMGVDAKNHTENGGTRVTSETNDNVMTRLGVRGYANGHSELDDGKNREFEPFVELNWIHNTENYTVKMNQYKSSQSGARNLGEVKMGVEGKLNNNLTSWVNVGYQFGDHAYNDTQAMVGVKYSF